jgi:hypothetical protein
MTGRSSIRAADADRMAVAVIVTGPLKLRAAGKGGES